MFVTAVCVLFLIKLRWPKKKSIYDLVYVRYGQKTLKAVRDYDNLNLNRFNKVSLDIGFLQKCQLFHICPNFLHFKLSRREFQDTPACRRFKKDLLKFELNLLNERMEYPRCQTLTMMISFSITHIEF